jgi:hypothetical protein
LRATRFSSERQSLKNHRQGVNGKKHSMTSIGFVALLLSFVSLAGCSLTQEMGASQGSGSGFLRKEFLDYKRVAVLPFEGDSTGEVSDAFSRSFHEKFPWMTIVGRREISKRFQDKTLSYGKLEKETKTEIGKIYDVQTVVMGSVYYPSIVRWLLQIVLVDTQTDTVLGRSYVEINFVGAEGMKQACDLVVQQLVVR